MDVTDVDWRLRADDRVPTGGVWRCGGNGATRMESEGAEGAIAVIEPFGMFVALLRAW